MTAAPPFSLQAPSEIEPAPLLKFSFYCFCVFNLAYYSRFFEWQLWYLHVPLVTSTIALLGAAMEGKLLSTLGSKIGTCMVVLTVLYAINIPLSSWKGGSFETFTQEWVKSVTAFVIAGALVANVKQCRTALYSIGFGAGIGSVLVNWKGEVSHGRLSFGRGTFGNANAIAFDMLLGIPFLALIVLDRNSGKFKRLVAFCLMLNCVVALLRTGSRNGIIGFAVLAFLLFLRSSAAGKLGMIFAGVLAVSVFLAAVPNSTKERYLTIFMGSDVIEAAQNEVEASDVGSAVDSAAERRRLLLKAIEASFSHPVFGVGIGQFESYEAGVENLAGHHTGWQGTHNTYVQISSEAGMPALIVYLAMMWFIFSGLRRIYKRADKIRTPQSREVGNLAYALFACLVAYAVCVMFAYIAYDPTLPVLAGFTVALVKAGTASMDAMERHAAQQPQVQTVDWLPLNPARPGRWVRPNGYAS